MYNRYQTEEGLWTFFPFRDGGVKCRKDLSLIVCVAVEPLELVVIPTQFTNVLRVDMRSIWNIAGIVGQVSTIKRILDARIADGIFVPNAGLVPRIA